MKNLLKLIFVITILSNYSCKTDYSKLSDNIDSNLLLAYSIDKKSKELIGEGDSFVIMQNGWVEASLDLSDYYKTTTKNLMVHLDWIDENGNSFYKKMVLLSKKSPKLYTAISISPKLRKSGKYKLNVYVYRELVYSKAFNLFPAFETAPKEKINLAIKTNKSTYKLKNATPSIHLMKNKWIQATVKLKNIPKFDIDLLYQFIWTDEHGKKFYKKKFSIPSNKKSKTMECAIEIDPKKKHIGKYTVQLLLFDKPIATKNFNLKSVLNAKKITAKGSLCKAYKNGKKIAIATDFIRSKKNKVIAVFDLANCLAFGDEEQLNFKIVWMDTVNKNFYTKHINFTPKSDTKTIKSSISTSSKKRKSGKYKVQLYLFNQLLNSDNFNLH